MGRAKDDLAELVAFRSVADAKQYPPEECEKAAQWVVDAFTEVGLQDVAASPTPDGSKAVHGHAPGPPGTPTVLLYSPLRRAAAARRGRLDEPGVGADRARRALVRARRGRLQGQHRHAPHRAARAQAGRRRLPVRRQADLRGLGGAGHGRPGGVRARRTPTCCAPTRSSSSTPATSPSACPTLTTTLRGMTSVDITLSALGSAMHSGMFGGPAPDPVVALIQMLVHAARRARQHDGRRARRDADVDRRRLPGRAVPRRRQRARRRRS